MINTWWATRPKRNISGIAPILSVVATYANGHQWKFPDRRTELAIEAGLEKADLKRIGKRRDQSGGGARTYRAWLKSLGLVFMDRDGRLWLTQAGEDILDGEPPLPIISKLILSTQFPSAFTAHGQSEVAARFRVRPFVFLLQLLADPRLGGYLDEFEEIAKIVICHGVSNRQEVVDDVVKRILAHRMSGDSSLEENYVELFRSSRSKARTRAQLFRNFRDIANTFANQISFTQLVAVQQRGRWEIAEGALEAVRQTIDEYRDKKLIEDADDEEKFQRRFGLPPGKHKDTRQLDLETRNVSGVSIAEREIRTAFLALSTTQLIPEITSEIVATVAQMTGAPESDVERYLARQFAAGGVGVFMAEYAALAFGPRERATDFERATASIFSDVFGFRAKHIGQQGIRPDVVFSSPTEKYAGILDTKAYGKSYSATHDQRNRMVNYVRGYVDYAIDENPLVLFSYVVSEYKPTITSQIGNISNLARVPGSAITARDIIHMVQRHNVKKYSHAEIREILSRGKGLTNSDLMLVTSN